eukprot:1157054-Pelagomonas_calceolata.AAC.8
MHVVPALGSRGSSPHPCCLSHTSAQALPSTGAQPTVPYCMQDKAPHHVQDEGAHHAQRCNPPCHIIC